MARLKLRFHPQAWINDYATEIDPQGETEWSIEWPADRQPPDDDRYESDDLIDENAPAWIQEAIYNGPFYIEVLNRDEFPRVKR